MKNKKKNWRRILLRGSALMAAVVMCFAGSFPAFAAEPGGSDTLLRAGTYRFNANTVSVSPSSNVLEGEWTWKDSVSIPDWDLGSHSFSYPFSCYYSLTSQELQSLVDSAIDELPDLSNIVIQDYSLTFNFSGFDIYISDPVTSNFVVVDYIVSSVDVVPYDPLVEQFASFFVPSKEYYHTYGGWHSDWLRTVDFGSGVAVESPAFYQWFTSNAIPHREMWTLTERLQAVAASIWSVIVTISSTIVLNPLLLFTSGFLFLGGCIAFFSRLLARR